MRLASKLKMYHKWWKAWGTLPVAPWVAAAAYYRASQFGEAAKLYRIGLGIYPSHPAALSASLDLAYCLFKSGAIEEAHTELKSIVGRSPKSREAYIRLAALQMWLGQSLEAAWTMRRALRNVDADGELVGGFLLAVLENGGPKYLRNEAMGEAEKLLAAGVSHPKLSVALAKQKIKEGDAGLGRIELESLANENNASRDAVLAYSEVLVQEGKIAQSRQHLRRLMTVSSEHPRVLSLLAESYLKSGAFYNTEYAVQLATSACQKSNWVSPREMHVLAEAYFHAGDKIAAHLVASKAKDAGNKLLGTYPEAKNLDRLIESVSTGTQA